MKTIIHNVRVFDGEHTTASADVVVDGERIADVTPHSRAEATQEIDGAGRTLLPGLIDAHTHSWEGSLEQALAFGVTTVLDMFSVPKNFTRLREIAAGSYAAADLRTAGVGATAPNGHPIQIMKDIYGPFATVAGPADAEPFVTARLADHSDYLKIVIDDGSASGMHIPCLDAASVSALVSHAHDAGLLTIAHVATARDTMIALDTGIDGLAHVYTDAGPDGDLAERIAARAADQGVFVVGAMAFTEIVTGSGEGVELVRDPRIARRLSPAAKAAVDRELTGFPVHPHGKANALHAAAALHRTGVPLIAGTDANDGPHGGFAAVHGATLHRELVLLTEAGLTPAEALAAATSVPADRFRLTDRGRIARDCAPTCSWWTATRPRTSPRHGPSWMSGARACGPIEPSADRALRFVRWGPTGGARISLVTTRTR